MGAGASTAKIGAELREASAGGDSAKVTQILGMKEVDVNWFPPPAKNQALPDQLTALMKASISGHATVIQLLLAAPGISVNASTEAGATALIAAARANHIDVVKLLLAARRAITVDQADQNGYTALLIASQCGYVPILTLLLESGADINKCNYDGCSALIKASQFGQAEVAALLCATKGIDINKATNFRSTALSFAMDKEHQKAVDILKAQPGIVVPTKAGAQ